MPAQERELRKNYRKNYIGILSDKMDAQRAIEALEQSDRFPGGYLISLMAAVLKRRRQSIDIRYARRHAAARKIDTGLKPPN